LTCSGRWPTPLASQFPPFADLTLWGLARALAESGIALTDEQRDTLAGAYRRLRPFDDARPALSALREQGHSILLGQASTEPSAAMLVSPLVPRTAVPSAATTVVSITPSRWTTGLTNDWWPSFSDHRTEALGDPGPMTDG
jgi:hypothetical protein